MSKPKVYVTRQLFDEALEILRRHAEVEVFGGVDDPAPRETILSNVRDVEGLLCLLTDRIDSEVIEAGRRLKVISDCAVGFNNIDVDAATKSRRLRHEHSWDPHGYDGGLCMSPIARCS